MILLKQLKLKNFLSHSGTVLDFNDNQKLLIAGKSGSGKSSLVDALIWCLFNRGRVEGRNLIKKGEKSAEVSVVVKADDKYFRIERSINDKGKHNLNVYEKIFAKEVTLGKNVDGYPIGNSKDISDFKLIDISGIKNIQEFIEKKILRSSYLLFVNSIVWPQNNTESFVTQTASVRKDILLEIINAGDFDAYYDQTKKKINILEIEQAVIDSKIIDLSKEIDNNKPLIEGLPEFKKKKEKLSVSIAKLKKDKEELQKKLNVYELTVKNILSIKQSLESQKQQILSTQNNLNVIKKELEKINDNTKIKEITQKISSLEADKEKFAKLKETERLLMNWNVKMMRIIEEKPPVTDFEKNIKEINRQLIALINKKIDNCPKLNEPCAIIVAENEARKKELEEMLKDQENGRKDYDKLNKIYEDKVKALGVRPEVDYVSLNLLENKIANLEKEKADLDEYVKNIEITKQNLNFKLNSENEKLSQVIVEYNKNSEELKKAESENKEDKNLLDAQIYGINKTLDGLEQTQTINLTSITMAENAVIKVETAKKELNGVEEKNIEIRGNLEALGLLKDAFSSTGIKSIILDYTIPKLEDKINEVLGQLSDFRVTLDTQRNSVSGENVIEGLYINIITPQNEQLSYENFSGGEKVKIASAIFTGLASLCHCNFRILDEAIVALDNESADQFIEVLGNLLKEIPQLICISHLDRVKELFEEKIEVIKKNGTSMLINS